MHKALIARGWVAFFAFVLVASGVNVPTAQAGLNSHSVTLETTQRPSVRTGPLQKDCAFYEIWGCGDWADGPSEAGNADLYLYSAENPCHDDVLSFWPGTSDKLFRWSDKHDTFWGGNAPEEVRLEFWAGPGTDVFVRPGWPGYHTEGTDPADRKASFDLMELHATGQEHWRWRLVSRVGTAKLDTWSDGVNEHDVMLSTWCQFKLDYHDPPGGSQQPVDLGTGAFPSAGYSYKAVDPCNETVNIKDNDTQRVFQFSTDSPVGVRMQFARKSDGIWGQFAAPAGALSSGQATIDLKKLVDAGSSEWQWRVIDGSGQDVMASNVCDITIALPPPPPPPPAPSSTAGFKEQASYSGDCAKRPAGTICATFKDGYVYLMPESLTAWTADELPDGRDVHIAVGTNHRYVHVLGTNLMKVESK